MTRSCSLRAARRLFAAYLLCEAAGLGLAGPDPALGADPERLACSSCEGLARRLALFPERPAFLQSYEPRPDASELPPNLANAAFVYDNAVAAVALVACGEIARARQIGDALVLALGKDRFFKDGRLRNAYAAGPVPDDEAPVGIPGYWSQTDQVWREDAYQVGSATGSAAWGALALLNVHAATSEQTYLDAAQRIMRWVNTMTFDSMGPGGFRGGYHGHEPSPVRLGWKSTEHNTDVYAVNSWLAQLTMDQEWAVYAKHAYRFLEAMWHEREGRFFIGTLPDGVTPNRQQTGLDAQLWPIIAVPGFSDRAPAIIAWTVREHGVAGGFDFNNDRDGAWIEGTAQAALIMHASGRTGDAESLFETLLAHRVGDGLVYASALDGLTTGLASGPDSEFDDFRYYRLPHIGATSWVVIAGAGWNPFTGRPVSGDNEQELSCRPKS